jgi:hypothetical protein
MDIDAIFIKAHNLIHQIRHEYSKESTNDIRNTLTLLFTTGAGLLVALYVGRALFHTSSSYYASLYRGEEDDIVQAVHEKAQKDDKQKDEVDFAVPLVGFVSFSTTWERRWQTLAMFSSSLAFILPMTLACWFFTIYMAVVLPLQNLQYETHYRPVIMLASTVYWMYLMFVMLDKSQTMGNREPFMRLWTQWWSYTCDYLPCLLVKTADLPATTAVTSKNDDGTTTTTTKTNKYVMGYHPHGIIAVGTFCAFATDSVRVLDLSDEDNDKIESPFKEKRGFSSLFPRLDRRVVTLPQNFVTPLLREYFLSMGCITSQKESFRSYLQTHQSNASIDKDTATGRAMIVVVGGAAESMMAEEGSINLVLRNRRGFVREAIMAGASLVPVLGFGETNLYHFWESEKDSLAAKWQRFVKANFGFASPNFRGRSIFLKEIGNMPYRTPVVVVVGTPIAPPTSERIDGKLYKDFAPVIDRKTDEPMNKDGKILKEWHTKYVQALEALYNQHKNAQWNMPGKSRSKSLRIIR